MRTLSETLGHFSAGFTLSTYVHSTPGMKQSAADAIGNTIRNAVADWEERGSSRRDTPQASLAPCRLHFLMFSAFHAEKAALSRRKNAIGRTAGFSRHSFPAKQKAIPFGMTFCFGGDKRDRTADLMTASCYRFVISSDLEYNTSVPSAKSAGFRKTLPTASTRFRAHLGHSLGQGGQVDLEKLCRSGYGL